MREPQDFYLLRSASSEKSIAINPSQVRYVVAGDDQECQIVFGHEHFVVVAGTLEKVVAELRGVKRI